MASEPVYHFVTETERDQHEPSELCICAPRLVLKTTGLKVEHVYWQHFPLDGSGARKPAYL